jgi:hypothetical protein
VLLHVGQPGHGHGPLGEDLVEQELRQPRLVPLEAGNEALQRVVQRADGPVELGVQGGGLVRVHRHGLLGLPPLVLERQRPLLVLKRPGEVGYLRAPSTPDGRGGQFLAAGGMRQGGPLRDRQGSLDGATPSAPGSRGRGECAIPQGSPILGGFGMHL